MDKSKNRHKYEYECPFALFWEFEEVEKEYKLFQSDR